MKIFFALAVLVVFFAMPVAAAEIRVSVHGEYVTFDALPQNIDGRVLVPARGVFEKLGFDVEWNAENQLVALTRNEFSILLTIGSAEFSLITRGFEFDASETHQLEVPAQIIGDRTFIPLRHPLEAIGYSLEWDGPAQTVRISSPQPELEINEGGQPPLPPQEFPDLFASGGRLPSPQERPPAPEPPTLWLHGFYAFGAFAQRELIRDMDSVSFGWATMEYDNGPRLNTSPAGGNEWHIPEGYELIANYPSEHGTRAHLSIFMDTSGGLNELLASENSRRQAVAEIMAELTRTYDAIGRNPFDGVTINFEGLRGANSAAAFTAFLTELHAQLDGRTLYVTVHPATTDGVFFDGYDFRAIGRLADRIILMTHDYHPRTLEGFVGTAWQRHAAPAPLPEIRHALEAITHPTTGVEEPGKIAIAFSFVNIGWFVDEEKRAVYPYPIAVSMETVKTRMAQPDTIFGWSDAYSNPYIIYTTEDDRHVFLWYKNSRSVGEKLQLANEFRITGASVWRMGIIPNAPDWDVWESFQ